ncbi:MAG: phosphotransferase [Myxococcales bacterium]|nr:phosphotransferase [Myxococcales bacterium]
MTFGQLGGLPAVAKALGPRDGPWRWYFERELALYRAFEKSPPPVRLARLLDASEAEGVLVFERLRGAALCDTRMARAPLGEALREALLESIDRWGSIAVDDPRWAAPSPSADERAALRAQLLEDPSAPLAWITEGLAACPAKKLLDRVAVDRALAALEAHPQTRASHGDLLLRNVLGLDDGTVAWIDLECAGPHAEGWDLGLVWVNVDDADRAAVERRANALGASGYRAWAACALFACAREKLYRTRSRADDARGLRLERDIDFLSRITG